jgi:VIT1/CCC1 family predicted Fe2+/Mn2+ transporter
MAASEYVSVSPQRDLEWALYRREESLAQVYPNVALAELAIALQLRGIDPCRRERLRSRSRRRSRLG